MHPEVIEWTRQWLPRTPERILEFGGADINGTVNHLFSPLSTHVVVDLVANPGVDVIGDCRTYRAATPATVVLCLEVAEHCERWQELITNAAANLTDDGTFIFTAAGPGRSPHSAWGDAAPLKGEHYENVDPVELAELMDATFKHFNVNQKGFDVRAVGTHPRHE